MDYLPRELLCYLYDGEYASSRFDDFVVVDKLLKHLKNLLTLSIVLLEIIYLPEGSLSFFQVFPPYFVARIPLS